MQKTQKLISIIIVNLNGKHFLAECLTSVFKQTYSPFEIIIVDNASVDGSVDFLLANFPQVKIVALKKNEGFAGGNNRGIEHAAGDLIVLLNNDTKVQAGWLVGLANAVSADNVAVASSLIITEGIPQKYYEYNGSINFLGHNIMRVFRTPEDIFFAGGASLIFKKNILGVPFDDDYFAYAEDVYVSMRARFLGYNVVHTNDSVVQHFGGGTTKKSNNNFILFLQERNRLLNSVLFFSVSTVVKLIPFFIINLAMKIVVSIFSKRYSVRAILKAHLWFVTHVNDIRKKRFVIRSEQRVNEKEIIAVMSGKLFNGENIFEKIINTCSLVYCRIVRLNTIELFHRST